MSEKKCFNCDTTLPKFKQKFCDSSCDNKYRYKKKNIGKEIRQDKTTYITFICENTFCRTDTIVSKSVYRRFNSKNECKDCRRWKKECEVCDNPHNKQGKTCSSKCAWVLKKKSYLKSCGTEHNLSRESSSRKNMVYNLNIKYGVDNVFRIEHVKDKIKKTILEKYGVDNPSKSLEIQNKKLETMINNGLTVPLNEKSKYDIYRKNCLSFTLFNINKFGAQKFGKDWLEKKSRENLHTDHVFSIKEGFDNNINAEIIGSILNLELLKASDNIKKGTDSWINIEVLIKNFNIFLENNRDYGLELKNKIEKNNKYFYENKNNKNK